MQALEAKTVAEIAAGSLAAVRVFERLGIDYCCGGKRPLDEVCREKGLVAGEIEREIEAAAAKPAPEQRDWTTAPLTELIAHIVATHHAYLVRELGPLSERVAKVERVYSARPEAIDRVAGLSDVFEALRSELLMHLRKEEMVLFPAIEAYESAVNARLPLPHVPFGTVANPIRMMEYEHENAGTALSRIRQITRDFETPEYACVTYKAMLSGLRELEEDLHMHIHLENNILFPRALKLEQ
jgi:regulator of cell morphogenesis and NO signaling